MNKNPFLNALAAALYIVAIVFVMNAFTTLTVPKNTILIPITMLGLFVLSAAVMGFLFVYQPFCLYFENHKQEAKIFFLKTLGSFACFTALFVAILLYTSA